MPAERKYSLDQREKAGELCIYEGLTLEQIFERTGIPLSTIKRWASEDEWLVRKREHFQGQLKLKQQLQAIKRKLAEAILEDASDTRKVYALARLLELDILEKAKIKEPQLTDQSPIDGPTGELSEETLRKIKEEIYGVLESQHA